MASTIDSYTACMVTTGLSCFISFVLAIFGAAYNYPFAHTLTAFFLILSLPLIYIYTQLLLKNKLQALLIVVILSISPATWVNSLGILSENLYILLSLITLIYYKRLDNKNVKQLLVFGLLLAALILTRTIGVSMLAAYITVAAFSIYKKNYSFRYFLIPVTVSLLIVITIQLLHKATIPSQYIEQIFSLIHKNNSNIQLEYNFSQQLGAISDAWFVSWLYYWNNNFILSHVLFALLGIFSLIGLILRLHKQKLDAYYLAFYLVILVAWPHPGQAARFIYPVLFILLAYSLYTIHYFFNKRSRNKTVLASNIILLFVFTSIAPSLSYTWNRYHSGKTTGYQYYKEFYSIPDYNKAKNIASMQSAMYADLEKIRSVTDSNDKIMFFVPAYISLLIDRIGIGIDFVKGENNELVIKRTDDVDYIYLTKHHPRKTREGINGLYTYKYFKDWTNLIWVSYSNETGEPLAYFLKVK